MTLGGGQYGIEDKVLIWDLLHLRSKIWFWRGACPTSLFSEALALALGWLRLQGPSSGTNAQLCCHAQGVSRDVGLHAGTLPSHCSLPGHMCVAKSVSGPTGALSGLFPEGKALPGCWAAHGATALQRSFCAHKTF